MKDHKLILIIILLLKSLLSLNGQTEKHSEIDSLSASANEFPPAAIVNPDYKGEVIDMSPPTRFSAFNNFQFSLAFLVCLVSIIFLVLEFYLIKNDKIKNEYAVRVFLVTIIIFGALFLVAAGYNNDQIAPIIGLLGTIAGYLLSGLNNNKEKSDEK